MNKLTRNVIVHDFRSPVDNFIHLPKQTAKGRYKVQVVAPDGSLVVDRPWAANLILNNGLDGLAVRSWQASCAYCAAGTDNTVTTTDSGSTTATQGPSSDQIVFSSDMGSAIAAGYLIRWDSGATAVIESVTNGTTVVAVNSASVSAGLFTIYRINQTTLFTEASRSTSYLTGAGNCGTSLDGNTKTLKRTYEFDPEVSPLNYAELGFSWSGSAGDNLFSRVLIDGGAVAVGEGFQLRVVYELSITITPVTSQARTVVIDGWINRVASTTITNVGSGGTPGDYTLDVTGGNGDDFAGTYTIGGGGTLASITITNPGSGYTVAPTLSFPSGDIGGGIGGGVAATANLDAWTQGDEMVQAWGLEEVNTSGSGTGGDPGGEPCNAGYTVTSEADDALAAVGTSDPRSRLAGVANVKTAYVAGEHTIYKVGTFGVLESLSEEIRALMLTGGIFSGDAVFTYLFDNPQTKLNTHKLEVTWVQTWGRSF